MLRVAVVVGVAGAYLPVPASPVVVRRRPGVPHAPVLHCAAVADEEGHSHGGHAHSHAHTNIVAVLPGYLRWLREHLGDAMRGPKALPLDKSAEFRLADGVTWLGAAVNVLLTVFKGYAGVVSHSAAMIADAVHSLSDLLSDVVTLISMRMARLPPDEDHGYGHERFETVGAMFVGAMLLAAAWGLGETALASLRASIPLATTVPLPATTSVAPDVLNAAAAAAAAAAAVNSNPLSATGISSITIPEWLAACKGNIALWAAMVSIVAKEALYRGTTFVAERLRSPALRANAWHHRSDAMSSVVALVGIFAAAVGGPRFAFADGVAAGIVALMLGAMGLRISVEALAELTDTVDEADLRAVRESVQRVEGVQSVERSRGRLVGGALAVDVDVVPTRRDLTASASARLAERARLAIIEAPDLDKELKQATIRVVPAQKVCPVVASMPSQERILDKVTGALKGVVFRMPFALHDTQVHYEGLQPVIDLYLDPVDKRFTVAHLDDSAAAVVRHLHDVLGDQVKINKVYWLSGRPSVPATTAAASPVF